MPTKELQDVLREAQEVTSLDTTAKLALIGADGKLNKAAFDLLKDIKTAGSFSVSNGQWLRIAKYAQTQSPTGMLFLTHTWNNASPSSTAMVIGAVAQYQGIRQPLSVKVLYSSANPSFNSIRCVAEGTDRYVEVRLNVSSTNKPTVRLVGVGFELTPFSISTAADADVINTVSLISGGGKTLLHNQLRNYVERRWVA